MFNPSETPQISVIGLGYVGLPLAIALAKHYPVVGYDIDLKRVEDLKKGYDRTHEINESRLRSSSLHVTSELSEISPCNVYIITVPTPIDQDNRPDLSPLENASKGLAPVLKKGDIVVYESTVYPGVTEDVCGPILEEVSGLKSGTDFFLGYSPERINPGDKVHTVDKITKVVAGQTSEVADFLCQIYGCMNGGNIYKAQNIKTAEAAKVIENTQRDINIAFINEISGIFSKIGISVHDVLEAAGTKWNFLNFRPGLVGGHCIGVDPYYLSHLSEKLNHAPEVILAGRKTNENMSLFLAKTIDHLLNPNSKILILGLTFKENIPDLRNTKIIDLVNCLEQLKHEVDVHDPHAHPDEAKDFFGIELRPTLDPLGQYDCVVGAVAHKGYLDFTADKIKGLLKPNGLVADLKNIWSGLEFNPNTRYWRL